MNKKWLLTLGGITAIALPVSTVVACGDDVVKKSAVVTTTSPAKVVGTVKGSENAYTLKFIKGTDTASKKELEEALTSMVAKAANDKTKVDFKGTWKKDFDISKNDTYTYTVKAKGYNDVTFAITVTDDDTQSTLSAAKKRAKSFLNKLKYPNQDDSLHQPLLFKEIGHLKSDAWNAINSADTPEQVTKIASSETKGTEIVKILLAIKKYNSSTVSEEAKNLAKAKATAKNFIGNVDIPNSDDTLHKPWLYAVIFKARDAARVAIKAAATPEEATKIASSKTEGTGIEKIISAIKAYNSSTLTDAEKNLILAKNNAFEFFQSWLNKAKMIDNPSDFMNISNLNVKALKAIKSAKSIEEVKKLASSKTEGTLIVEIKKAVENFNAS